MNTVSPDLHQLLHVLWSKAVHQDGYEKREWQTLDALLHDREALSEQTPPFATLYNTWDELNVLAGLVDAELEGTDRPYPDRPTVAMLSSLRTQLREAQFMLRPFNR